MVSILMKLISWHCFDALEGNPSLSERVGLRCKEGRGGVGGGKYSIWEISHQGKPLANHLPPVFHVRNQCSLLLTSISINQPKPRYYLCTIWGVERMRIHSRACMTCSQWGGGSFGDGGQADKSSFVAVLLLLSLLGNTLMLPLPTR